MAHNLLFTGEMHDKFTDSLLSHYLHMQVMPATLKVPHLQLSINYRRVGP